MSGLCPGGELLFMNFNPLKLKFGIKCRGVICLVTVRDRGSRESLAERQRGSLLGLSDVVRPTSRSEI